MEARYTMFQSPSTTRKIRSHFLPTLRHKCDFSRNIHSFTFLTTHCLLISDGRTVVTFTINLAIINIITGAITTVNAII